MKTTLIRGIFFTISDTVIVTLKISITADASLSLAPSAITLIINYSEAPNALRLKSIHDLYDEFIAKTNVENHEEQNPPITLFTVVKHIF